MFYRPSQLRDARASPAVFAFAPEPSLSLTFGSLRPHARHAPRATAMWPPIPRPKYFGIGGSCVLDQPSVNRAASIVLSLSSA